MQNNNIKKILKFVFATFFLVAIIMTPVFFAYNVVFATHIDGTDDDRGQSAYCDAVTNTNFTGRCFLRTGGLVDYSDYKKTLENKEDSKSKPIELIDVEKSTGKTFTVETAKEETGGLVPCTNNCTIARFFTLINNIINFLLFTVAIPLAAIGFAWAGWLYLTAGGNSGQIEKAHDIFRGIFIGLAIALAAWLIVSAILSGLGVEGEVRGSFNLLK